VSRLVIDSSVVIKWFVPEVHSDDALRYFDLTWSAMLPNCSWLRWPTSFGKRSDGAN
jgi:hypothetical protein